MTIPKTSAVVSSDCYSKLVFAAKHLFCVPATSTPSEHIFSKAGYVVNKTRSSLLPESGQTHLPHTQHEKSVGRHKVGR